MKRISQLTDELQELAAKWAIREGIITRSEELVVGIYILSTSIMIPGKAVRPQQYTQKEWEALETVMQSAPEDVRGVLNKIREHQNRPLIVGRYDESVRRLRGWLKKLNAGYGLRSYHLGAKGRKDLSHLWLEKAR